MKTTPFDKTAVYSEKILPLAREITALCAAFGIPAFLAFAVKNSEDGTTYDRHVVHGASQQILKEDAIRTALLKINGFDTVYPGNVMKAISVLQNYESEKNRNVTYSAISKDAEDPNGETEKAGREVMEYDEMFGVKLEPSMPSTDKPDINV